MIWKMADTLTEYKILGRSNIQMVRAGEGSISCHLTKCNRRTVNGSFSFFFFYRAQASIRRCQAAAESGLWSSSQMTD